MVRPCTLSVAGRRRLLRPAAAVILLGLFAGACVPPSVAPPSPESQPAEPVEQAGEAALLRLTPEAPMPGG